MLVMLMLMLMMLEDDDASREWSEKLLHTMPMSVVIHSVIIQINPLTMSDRPKGADGAPNRYKLAPGQPERNATSKSTYHHFHLHQQLHKMKTS